MIALEKIKNIVSFRGNETCIVDNGTHFSWLQLLRRTESRILFLRKTYTHEQLHSACYVSKNSFDVICWLAAFSTLGIPANGLDYSLPVDTLITLVKKINPGIFLVSSGLYSPEALNKLKNAGCTVLSIDLSTTPVEHPNTELEQLIHSHTSPPFKAISLTSGTSSLPKIALRFSSFDARRFSWFTERYGFNSNDGFLLLLPLYHAAGNGWARMFMGLGCSVYIVDQDDDARIVKALSQKKITTSVMTPNLVSKLTRLAKNGNDTSYLRWVLVGGSYFSAKDKISAIHIFGPIFYEYYGCTESGVNVISEPADMISTPKSVGKPFDGNHVVIVDKNNVPVDSGKIGRVAISSYMMMNEYSDGSRPFYTINDIQYFLMADHGYLDPQGRLFLINRNGECNTLDDNYGIEEEIRKLPCISDAAVISSIENGKPVINCIFSTHHKGKDEDTLKTIKHKINKNNTNIKHINEIPYSPSGKVRTDVIIHLLDINHNVN